MEAVNNDAAMEGIKVLLQNAGQDPQRDGLLDTPKRYVKAFNEMTAGYNHDPKEILSRQFEQDKNSETYSGIVVLSGITFFSLCEHHLLPFYGTVDIAYIPNKETNRIVGISKLARLVECYARRLQVQERMNSQISNAITEHLEAAGVLVRVSGKHMCMMSRGVKQSNANMVTSTVAGIFSDSPAARAEALDLFNMNQ